MIVFAGSRLKGTDPDGNTQSVGVLDAEQNSLRVGDDESRTLLNAILKELKILNLHMAFVTDNFIEKEDVDDGEII